MSGFQTQSYVREKSHSVDTQWTEEVALMPGFGICQCHGWKSILVHSVALGSTPSVVGETPEGSLDLQGLIHLTTDQGDDRHSLISGREWQTSVNKRQTY